MKFPGSVIFKYIIILFSGIKCIQSAVHPFISGAFYTLIAPRSHIALKIYFTSILHVESHAVFVECFGEVDLHYTQNNIVLAYILGGFKSEIS